MVSEIILSDNIYLTQQNYQHHQGSNGKIPSGPSVQESDEENVDDEI